MMPEPLLVPFTDKGKEVSPVFLGVCSRTENWNRKSSPGPMGISPVNSANGTGCTASGCLRVYARRAATTVQLKKSSAWSRVSGSQTGSRGISQGQRG